MVRNYLRYLYIIEISSDHEIDQQDPRRQALHVPDEGHFLRTLCGGRRSNQNRSDAGEVIYRIYSPMSNQLPGA